jgi:hypothetical protein
VIEREPDWSRLPANVPARARELLRLCLEKNPKNRRRDAGDAPLEFALSPDGRHIVFVASVDGRRRLWLRALNKVDAQAMTGTDGAAYPFWSADSRSIGYFTSRKLYRIDIGGGPPQELADVPVGRGGTWNADGTIVFAPTDDGPLVRIAAPWGEPSAVTHLDPGQTSHRCGGRFSARSS